MVISNILLKQVHINVDDFDHINVVKYVINKERNI